MKSRIWIWGFLMCALNAIIIHGDEDYHLISVIEIARHGEKYPTLSLPNWRITRSQELTPMGVKEHYLVGRNIRQRYMKQLLFLSSNPSQLKEEIKVRATNTQRTVKSARAQLVGITSDDYVENNLGEHSDTKFDAMFDTIENASNAENAEISKDLEHRVRRLDFKYYIPPKSRSDVFSIRFCEGGNRIAQKGFYSRMEKIMKSEEYLGIKKVLDELYPGGRVSMNEQRAFLNTLISANYHGKPTGVNKSMLDDIKQILNELMVAQFLQSEEGYTLLAQGIFVQILTDLLNYRNTYIKQKLISKGKFRIYITHEVKILPVLALINRTFLTNRVPPAGNLIIELYANGDGDKFRVELRYNGFPLKLDDCTLSCPYTQFVDLIQARLLDLKQWKAKCL